ncbi:PP2A-like protein phosphatase [Ordospora colligata]|nr:PP2A-like protein phosphatase [Ordospora colligata]TBU15959.1 PP2A-like protein phosphatase [Ordospora colligata]TBU18853.1 PP2A-like protein phosphatase [Ordospora colligata]
MHSKHESPCYLKILRSIQNSVLPTRSEAMMLINDVKIVFASEPNVIQIQAQVNVVGDVHGQFYDLLNMLDLMGDPSIQQYLFLGDYVDRGYDSVDLILLLFTYKILYPDKIHLLRGNHETRMLSAVYGFRDECIRKYDITTYWRFCDAFQYLPIAAVVSGKYFCVHGGLVPGITLDFITSIDRVGEITELSNLLWSDPDEEPGYRKNPRGAGYLFGEDTIDDFLESNRFSHVVRSHQLVNDGYKSFFRDKLFTIWGAPNYCYSSGNVACVMAISENGHEFRIFDKCKQQFRDSSMQSDFFDG